MTQAIRKLSIVGVCSKGITVGRDRNWREKLMQHMGDAIYVISVCTAGIIRHYIADLAFQIGGVNCRLVFPSQLRNSE